MTVAANLLGSPKNLSDQCCDYMLVTPHATPRPDMMRQALIARCIRPTVLAGSMSDAEQHWDPRGLSGAINNMDHTHLCRDPEASVHSL